ncbi:MAG: DUF4124 domain-containing protein [Myxococcales bacterium]|nr:DUF4124 domain-containing protein [Myxococcales bacterium]
MARWLGAALLVASAAFAQGAKPVYTWTDADGVQHFTDDPNAVPKKAKARTTEGSHVNVVSSKARKDEQQPLAQPDPGEAQSAAAQAQAAAAQAQAAAAQAQLVASAQAKETVEDAWRRRFREAREKVHELEDEIEVDRKKVEEVDGLPVNAGWTCPTGWGVPYPPAVATPYAVSGGGVAVGGQVAPGVRVGAAVGSSYGWYYPSVITTPCWYGFNPDYERIRERLERNRKGLIRAKEELHDLERRAANEAVPLEWRR